MSHGLSRPLRFRTVYSLGPLGIFGPICRKPLHRALETARYQVAAIRDPVESASGVENNG